MAETKVHKVDWSGSDFLTGTRGLNHAQRGLYATVISLIYDRNGPVTRRQIIDECRCDWRSTDKLISHLVEIGKLVERDGMIDNPRCERELAAARKRLDAYRANGARGGRPRQPATEIPTESTLEMTPESTLEMTEKRLPEMAEPLEETKPSGFEPTNPPTHQPIRESEEQAKPEDQDSDFKNNQGLGGRRARAAPDRPATGAEPNVEPLTDDQRAEISARFDQLKSALRGNLPKGIRDAAAYEAAVKSSKFLAMVRQVNEWASAALAGDERLAAWELIGAAQEAGSGKALMPDIRRAFDALVERWRAAHHDAKAAA